MRDLMREMFYGFVAIAMLIELIGGDLFSLFFALEKVVEILEISTSLAYYHMINLSLLNAMNGLGACMVYYALRKPDNVRIRRYGVVLTSVGLILYALYQFWFASVHLGDVAIYVQLISIVYALFGIAAWVLGRELFATDWQPSQPVQRSPYDTLKRIKLSGW